MNSAANISPIRLEEHLGELCVQVSWLVESGLMTKASYYKLQARGKFRVTRRGCRNTPALVAFNSLSQRYKDIIHGLYGDIYKLLKRDMFAEMIQVDADAASFFSRYKLDDGRSLPAKVQKQYRTDAELLQAAMNLANKRASRRRALGGSNRGIWDDVSTLVNRLNKDYYPHTLPTNARRLQQKAKAFKKDGYRSLVSKKYGNDNSRKVCDRLELLILSLYCMENKPYSATVHELYHQFLGGVFEVANAETGELFEQSDFYKDGKAIEISDTTVWNYINDPKNRVIVDRYRSEAMQFNANHRPHHHRRPPTYSMSKVSMDDRDIMHKTDRADRKKVKAYYACDVLSGAIIGASHSIDKDEALFIGCMRDMLRFLDTHNLGMPLEVEVENHLVRGFEKGLMKAGEVFDFIRWCNPGNSQEKYAENVIRMKKYSAEKSSQPNIGRHYAKLEANRTKRKKIFDADNDNYKEKARGVEEIIADDLASITDFNNQKHPNQKKFGGMTRIEVFFSSLNPRMAKFDPTFIMQYIGEKTQTSIRRTQYCRVQYADYQLPDPRIIERMEPNNYNVDAYWLPNGDEEIQAVWLYQNGNFLCKCDKIEKYNTATAEQTQADEDARLEQTKYVSTFDKMTKELREKVAKVAIIKTEPVNYDELEVETVDVFIDEEEEDNSYEYYELEDYGKMGKDNL